MKIELTPEILKSQARQMEALMNQYDSLFTSVTNTLNQVNYNWSENLSNNFTAKIASAQKSFSAILDSLDFGATAANTSAMNFEDIDSQLAKVLSGVDLSLGTSGDKTYVAGESENLIDIFGENLESEWNKFIADYNATKDDAKTIKEFYDSLPSKLKDELEKAFGKENTGAVKVLFDILSGDISLKSFKPLVKAIMSEEAYKNRTISVKYDVFVETIDTIVNEKGKTGQLIDISDQLESIAHREFLNGDYVGFVRDLGLSLGVGLMVFPTGIAQIGTNVVVNAIDKPVQDIIKIVKFVDDVQGKALKNLCGNKADMVLKTRHDIVNGIETIWNSGTSGIKSLFR